MNTFENLLTHLQIFSSGTVNDVASITSNSSRVSSHLSILYSVRDDVVIEQPNELRLRGARWKLDVVICEYATQVNNQET
jgi:hypothetical protein